MGEIRSKRCEGVGITLKQLSGLAMPWKGLRLEGGRVSGKNLRLKMRWIAATTARTA